VSRPSLELAEIFRQHGGSYRNRHALTLEQLKPMRAIETCRTAALGGHVERCGHCAHQRISYNSCRNRHCPKCQTLAREQWLARRRAELLPVTYYHVVFTLPPAIAQLALQNKEEIYNLLFAASAQTLLTIAAGPKHLGANIGFFSILHTWGQNLLHHPHIHCVVTGGGTSPDRKRWISCRKNFFLSVRVLSRLFRRLFLEQLDQAKLSFHGQLNDLNDKAQLKRHLARTRKQDWVVYSKAPFGGPEKAIDYLGRYTHKVAITNHRLISDNDGKVSFRYKDYSSADPQKQRTMTLDADEFIRRFLLHAIPAGFQRIRHYGLCANRNREANLELCRKLLQAPQPSPLAAPGTKESDLIEVASRCPICKLGTMLREMKLYPIRWPARPP
jgi:predicted Zn-ribbon and HTH transcriptional regulator